MNEADPTGARLVGFSSSLTLQRSVRATLEAPSAGLWERHQIWNTWERKKLNLKVDLIILSAFRELPLCTSHLVFYPRCRTVLAFDSPPNYWFLVSISVSSWEIQMGLDLTEKYRKVTFWFGVLPGSADTFHEGKITAVGFWCLCLGSSKNFVYTVTFILPEAGWRHALLQNFL